MGFGYFSSVRILDTHSGEVVCIIQHRMLQAKLSPKGSFLIEWDNPSQSKLIIFRARSFIISLRATSNVGNLSVNVLEHDNFKIWSIAQGKAEVVYALKLSKFPDIEFSGDETLFARLSNNNVIFYSVPEFHNTAKKTPEGTKISKFSLSPGTGPCHMLSYVPCE